MPEVENLRAEPPREIEFCPRCFASSQDGSWGKLAGGGHCYNCGASGTVRLPDWAVKSIREQASWVGQRYYPNTEDRERQEELRTLRETQVFYPGRTVESLISMPGEPTRWTVSQRMPDGRTISAVVTAPSPEEAFAHARGLLPYVPERQYGKRG